MESLFQSPFAALMLAGLAVILLLILALSLKALARMTKACLVLGLLGVLILAAVAGYILFQSFVR